MIQLDFGILTSLTASVETLANTKLDFEIKPSKATNILLYQHQSIFRQIDGKGHILASDILATFNGIIIDNRTIPQLSNINKKIKLTFQVFLKSRSTSRLIDTTFKSRDLPAFQSLPLSLKPIYVISLMGDSPEELIIDNNFLMGLTPPMLSLKKSEIAAIRRKIDGKLLIPNEEDDLTRQYNFRNVKEGIYEISFVDNTKKEVYVNADLYTKPSLAIVEINLQPINQFPIKKYDLKFKKKP